MASEMSPLCTVSLWLLLTLEFSFLKPPTSEIMGLVENLRVPLNSGGSKFLTRATAKANLKTEQWTSRVGRALQVAYSDPLLKAGSYLSKPSKNLFLNASGAKLHT